MAYVTSQAIATFKQYASGIVSDYRAIDGTKDRGLLLTLKTGERVVVFIYPLVHKQDNTKNYFDTRDSGAYERAVAWNYALTHDYKYFCFGINDSVDKYVDYIFSLECEEKKIQELSGTVNGQRAGAGNQIIIPNDYIPQKPFDRIRNKLGVYISAIHKDALEDYIQKYDNRPYLLDKNIVPIPDGEEEVGISLVREEKRVSSGTNILLYGVPGSGKSYTIQKEYCSDESRMERLVFHPDYTYSDFVGQILPDVSEGSVTYRFTPGPFTTIMKKAYENPEQEFFLIIEEINRGNAPAIFGEVFQLLDRKEEIVSENDDGFPVGTSEYGISNSNIATIVYGDPEHKVRIPSNLSIIGTMNTSDQNVFTLDTAFQRRWAMRMVNSSFENVAADFRNHLILDTTITWEGFCDGINTIILQKNARITSSEDKRLGPYFIHKSDLVFDPEEDNDQADAATKMKARRNNRRFAEKVLKYLWDDAFKFSRSDVFKMDSFYSLEQVIHRFVTSRGDARFSMFIDDVVERFQNPHLN